MPRPRLSESVKYERECAKLSKTITRKMFSKVKNEFKKIEHAEAVANRKAERKKKVRVVMMNDHVRERVRECDRCDLVGIDDCSIFSNLPNDILREIYRCSVGIRNDDKKKEAVLVAANGIVEFLKIGCHLFGFSSREVIKIRGTITNFYMKRIDGEYKIKFISMKGDDEMGKMISECVMQIFNDDHVLVNKRRPTSGWIRHQLLTKTIEEISNETDISVYRLLKII
ncbi:hypothetical protein PBCVNY2B_488L [Paramecium bursaria Chlorella virus NY2B]|uniref:Uncharacterized protein n=1 Tax=Paramecium bursaria Chlorella virus NYs1 TaxID=83442 RepID=M1I8Z9_9PHYC|nr:hypothetical protein AR158_C427L [Paramecium bursaria Chlorella virus AR158]YP_009665401.1 hypothetical protein FK949_gp369 [Paramecium bursaria Chlorella virus NYs1]AGE54257.1 hypothetical protein PBCVIL52s1_508L [Paramecium bursaria Chlorella virus IL-5-2s1]AGE54896.1 hypothetical protein PBCVMA1D_371L [Paramecium bursaria Chlorella virus MA1D]AGE58371.1 hypothetical protein PBCVNY2B_488L [Paramecium bursaria Chlorella virus NY2B]ABU43972.1 hypothetical protein AR158_C427L [Paramecium bur